MMDVMAGRVAGGQTVEFRPRGSSMAPLIRSGQRVVVAPADPERIEPGDIVLTKVSGTVYLHLVSAVDRGRRRVRISNNRGRVNGWTGYDRVFGICVCVEGAPRAGVDSKVRRSSAADPLGQNRAVFDFGIEGYRPDWRSGVRDVQAAHGGRLRGLVGRRLTAFWVVWDLKDDEWFADCPVLLDFDGEQVGVNHWKFDEVSVTWNAVDLSRPVVWPEFELRWRDDALPEPAALVGQTLRHVELVEWLGPGGEGGGVDLGFVFADGRRVTVGNALDENGLDFEQPGPRTRVHVLC